MNRSGETPEGAGLALLILGVLLLAACLAITVSLAGLARLPEIEDLGPTIAWLWEHRGEPPVRRWLLIGGLTALGPLALLPIFAQGARPSLHGRARFASETDIRRGGFRARDGLILGRRGSAPLVFGGEEHVMLYAPTRSGKGVGVVIPNLLNWPDSLVVLDIKRENWTASAGFRAAHGQQVICFDPLDPEGRTHRYNPLGHIDRRDPIAVLDELQRIAVMLLPHPERADPFWSEAARTGFIGVGALVAASPDTPFSLGAIYQLLTTSDLRRRLAEEIADGARRPLSPGAIAALTDFCSASENTFAGVKQTITARMNLWLNPRVATATEVSDFDLREVRDRRMSIYLCTSPDNLDRVAPLYGLFFQQLVDLNTRTLPASGHHQVPVLVLLDEFARLGQASVLAHAFSYVAGYGLRLLPVLQSPAQLRNAYGVDLAEDIIANCGAEVVFAPKDLKIARELSERLGAYTYEALTRSRPSGFSGGTRTVTVSGQRRPLILPQELMQMPAGHLLVFRAGVAPIRGRKIRYYRERVFQRRVCAPPEPPRLAALDPDLFRGPSRAPSRPMTEAEAGGQDPLTIEMVAPTLQEAEIEPLRAGASEQEILAWVDRVVDAGLLPADLAPEAPNDR